MQKKIIISVTSDLVSDQRVHKVAQTLHEVGFDITLVGRKKKNSQKLDIRDYKTVRFNLLFDKSFLFYINYQIILFFYLLLHKSDIVLSNDLDTLLPNYIISKIKNTSIVYDTHEYYTGVPELLQRPKVRAIWKKIEDYIFPKLPIIYTVNESIAKIYTTEYGNNITIIRNLPFLNKSILDPEKSPYYAHYQTIRSINLPIILYQGAVNKDRGLEEVIEAMTWIDNAKLVIIGDGDVLEKLKNKTSNITNKVYFTGNIPFQYLPQFTALATLGISLEKPTNINYTYASPNKVVDYIHAEVPVLASKLIEIDKIITQFEVGLCIDWQNAKQIADAINNIIFDVKKINNWKQNCILAKNILCWENEKHKLIKQFKNL